jgi:hypothetical protein
MARYRVLTWRDIPVQVRVFRETGRPLGGQLPERFQQDIDRLAMREGLTGTDAYVEQFRWSEDRELDGTPEDVLARVLAELEHEALGSENRGEPGS